MIAKYCPEYSFTKPSTLVAVSGSGNVAQYTALKVIELGGTVLSLSDSKGSLISTSSSAGYTQADVEAVMALKLRGGSLESLAETDVFKSRFAYHAGKRPWTLLEKIHIALPGTTQNEISGEDAHALIKAGVKIVAEGSNMVRSSSVSSDCVQLTGSWLTGLDGGGRAHLRGIAQAGRRVVRARQGVERRRRRRLRPRDGAEQPAAAVDRGRSGREAEGNHDPLLRDLPRRRRALVRRRARAARQGDAQPPLRRERRWLHQGRGRDAQSGRLVVSVKQALQSVKQALQKDTDGRKDVGRFQIKKVELCCTPRIPLDLL